MDGWQKKKPKEARSPHSACPARRMPASARSSWRYRKVKFRKNLLGGVDEVQMWKKLEELYGLYENAIRAERARYNALLEAHTPPGENLEEGC